ncbi:invasion associated locus B family protein [Halocynthiibacter namhaensis]|uniref:invasion associated locus B family protein n=1 Tax=Halocynthiibacter namhaensis TaxID=1290553 RepID=UPI00057998A4|nr:invasion associated locus B family protein [Halocynthiibacter namhaensis]
MKSHLFRTIVGVICLGAVSVAGSVTGALAQATSTNRVAAQTDWSVFVDDSPTQCWAVSGPKATVNTDASGRPKAVNRGQILMFVTWNPSSEISAQVSFTGGYPFASGSTVKLEIGASAFELFTTGENAWAASPADDARIVTAMKRGASAVLTGRSGRGTITKDTFSLLGFTAAVDEAGKRCDG